MSLNKLLLLFRMKPLTIRLAVRTNLIQYSQISIQPCIVKLANQTQLAPQQNIIIKRFKKSTKKSRNNNEDEEANDEDDDDELAEENPLLVDDLLESNSDGSRRLVIDVSSLRLDGFAKTAFGSTRAKIEEAFYKGELYLNGERPSKKSVDLSINDEIDLIKGINAEDRNLIDIKRVLILELPDKATEQGRMKVTISRWEDLTIKAYRPD